MTEEKTCYNCGNKNCIVYYSTTKKDCKRHYETYEYTNFECVNHDKWEEMKVEENRTDSTETLKNALERIAELEETNERIASKYYELQKTLKKVRVALIQERVANIMNYGKGGAEMFDDLLKMIEQEVENGTERDY